MRFPDSFSPGRWARAVAVVIGTLLILDSLSQLMIAAMPWNPANVTWRALAGRLLLTQVTPICLAGCILVAGLVQRPSGWRSTGMIALVGALLIGIVTAVWWSSAQAQAGTVPARALPSYNRGMWQGLTSGFVLTLGLLAAGAVALREARSRVAT